MVNYRAAIGTLKIIADRHYDDLSPALYATVIGVVKEGEKDLNTNPIKEIERLRSDNNRLRQVLKDVERRCSHEFT